jgi:hypothetical protein
MSEPMEEQHTYPMKQSATFAGSTLITMGLVDLMAHLGPTGLLVGGWHRMSPGNMVLNSTDM